MKKWIVGIVVAAVVLGGAGFAFWYTQIRVESDPVAEISETPVQEAPESSIDGTYEVVQNAEGFVGYRAEEIVLGGPGTPTGRTSDVTGSLTISGQTIDDVEFRANLTGLSTGNERRDGRAQGALATDQFPDATFVLTEPIELTVAPTAGETVTATAVGELTVKGITKRVEIPIEGRWDGTEIQIITAEPFPITFSDFGVDVGSFAPFAEVEDEGGLEIKLFLAKA
ncbi:MAG: YceI family protein [Acidimicrobiia bacterium]